jgi:hypothetical protein
MVDQDYVSFCKHATANELAAFARLRANGGWDHEVLKDACEVSWSILGSHPRVPGTAVRRKVVGFWERMVPLAELSLILKADDRAREAALAARPALVNIQYDFQWYGLLRVVIKDGDLKSPWLARRSVRDMLALEDEDEAEGLLNHLTEDEMATIYNVDDRVWIKPVASVDVVSPAGFFKVARLAADKYALAAAQHVRWKLLPPIRRGELPPRVTAQDILGHHDFNFEGDVVRAHTGALTQRSIF